MALIAWSVLLSGAAAAQGRSPQPPSIPAALALVRSTLIAVDQANQTDNYGVLRELGTPAFVESNSAEFLSQAFKPWREPGRDFAFVAIAQPQLARPPVVDERGVLRIVGRVPTPNFDLSFDLAYQLVEGRWRVAGILIRPEQPQVQAFGLDSLGEVARTTERPPRTANSAPPLAPPSGDRISDDTTGAADGAPLNVPLPRRPDPLPPLPLPRP